MKRSFRSVYYFPLPNGITALKGPVNLLLYEMILYSFVSISLTSLSPTSPGCFIHPPHLHPRTPASPLYQCTHSSSQVGINTGRIKPRYELSKTPNRPPSSRSKMVRERGREKDGEWMSGKLEGICVKSGERLEGEKEMCKFEEQKKEKWRKTEERESKTGEE